MVALSAGLMAGVQDATSAVLGIAAAAMVVDVAAPDVVPSVVALVALSSLTTGVILYLLGRFNFGGLARFLPYTLVGGFLAATGVVIIQGGLSILRGGASGGVTTATLWAVVDTGRCCCGRFVRPTPANAYDAHVPRSGWREFFVALHLGFLAAGIGHSEAIDRGWLLGSGDQVAWSPALVVDSLGADWAAVLPQAGALATVVALAAVSLLLYSQSLEAALRHDIDLDRELMVAGAGNVVAGLAGGPPGYTYSADTVLLYRLGAGRRGAALVAAGVVAAALIAGPSLLTWIPRGVVGGLLLYVGITLVIEWLWDARDRLTPVDQAVILRVVLGVAFIGLVTGLVTGLVLAVITFVVRYSRIGVVERVLHIDEVPVSIERPSAEMELIEQPGPSTMVLELNGYLFFGTAHFLVEAVQERLAEPEPPLRLALFDLEGVTGVDASALGSIDRLIRYGREHAFTTILAGSLVGSERIWSRGSEGRVRLSDEFDQAVKWCQDEILRAAGAAAEDDALHSLTALLSEGGCAGRRANGPWPSSTAWKLESGNRIIEQGEAFSRPFLSRVGSVDRASGTRGRDGREAANHAPRHGRGRDEPVPHPSCVGDCPRRRSVGCHAYNGRPILRIARGRAGCRRLAPLVRRPHPGRKGRPRKQDHQSPTQIGHLKGECSPTPQLGLPVVAFGQVFERLLGELIRSRHGNLDGRERRHRGCA